MDDETDDSPFKSDLPYFVWDREAKRHIPGSQPPGYDGSDAGSYMAWDNEARQKVEVEKPYLELATIWDLMVAARAPIFDIRNNRDVSDTEVKQAINLGQPHCMVKGQSGRISILLVGNDEYQFSLHKPF